MTEPMPEDVQTQVRLTTQRYRDGLGDDLFRADARWRRFRRNAIRVIGAMAVGVFSSGFAILAAVVLLNIFFHFAPS